MLIHAHGNVKKAFLIALAVCLMALYWYNTPRKTYAATRTINCSTVACIQSAMLNAQPGDDIIIDAGTYTGSKSTSGFSNAFFYSGVNGTPSAPITIESASTTNEAILSGTGTSSGYALYITGDYWIVKNLKVTNAQKGIVLDHSNYSVLDNVEVYGLGQEGVHFRDGSSNNTLQNSYVHDTGKIDPGCM